MDKLAINCQNFTQLDFSSTQARVWAEDFPGKQRKKRPKNSKKYRKIVLLSLYVLYLYHV